MALWRCPRRMPVAKQPRRRQRDRNHATTPTNVRRPPHTSLPAWEGGAMLFQAVRHLPSAGLPPCWRGPVRAAVSRRWPRKPICFFDSVVVRLIEFCQVTPVTDLTGRVKGCPARPSDPPSAKLRCSTECRRWAVLAVDPLSVAPLLHPCTKAHWMRGHLAILRPGMPARRVA